MPILRFADNEAMLAPEVEKCWSDAVSVSPKFGPFSNLFNVAFVHFSTLLCGLSLSTLHQFKLCINSKTKETLRSLWRVHGKGLELVRELSGLNAGRHLICRNRRNLWSVHVKRCKAPASHGLARNGFTVEFSNRSCVPWNHLPHPDAGHICPVIFVGDGRSGKSYLASCLVEAEDGLKRNSAPCGRRRISNLGTLYRFVSPVPSGWTLMLMALAFHVILTSSRTPLFPATPLSQLPKGST